MDLCLETLSNSYVLKTYVYTLVVVPLSRDLTTVKFIVLKSFFEGGTDLSGLWASHERRF